jgi:hypothetical protein
MMPLPVVLPMNLPQTATRTTPPPTLGELRHRLFPGCLVAVRRGAIFVLPVGQLDASARLRGCLHDAADDDAPSASRSCRRRSTRRTGESIRALEDEGANPGVQGRPSHDTSDSDAQEPFR